MLSSKKQEANKGFDSKFTGASTDQLNCQLKWPWNTAKLTTKKNDTYRDLSLTCNIRFTIVKPSVKQ